MNPYQSKSKSFQKLNPHLFPPDSVGPLKAKVLMWDAPMVRQRNKPLLNKTEERFKEYLLQLKPTHLMEQAITFRLGNGVRYTPDFVGFFESKWLAAYEVKGFMRDDASVKLKVAAGLYPWIDWYLVSSRNGVWQFQIILP